MKKTLVTLCLIIVSLLAWPAAAQDIHTPLRQGDQAYELDKYQQAEQHYRIAAEKKYGDAQAVYNLGNALYQQGKWEDAAKRFLQAANSAENPEHKANAFHNLGNALMKLHTFDKAVQAYEQSLRLRPADEDAKQNLQTAKKKLKEEQQKEREKQQQQQQNQNQQPQNQQQQQQQNQNQQQPQQPQQNQPPPPKPEEQNGEKQRQKQEQQLKKEDAKRLLETAISPEDRKNAQKYRAAQQRTRKKGADKDW